MAAPPIEQMPPTTFSPPEPIEPLRRGVKRKSCSSASDEKASSNLDFELKMLHCKSLQQSVSILSKLLDTCRFRLVKETDPDFCGLKVDVTDTPNTCLAICRIQIDPDNLVLDGDIQTFSVKVKALNQILATIASTDCLIMRREANADRVDIDIVNMRRTGNLKHFTIATLEEDEEGFNDESMKSVEFLYDAELRRDALHAFVKSAHEQNATFVTLSIRQDRENKHNVVKLFATGDEVNMEEIFYSHLETFPADEGLEFRDHRNIQPFRSGDNLNELFRSDYSVDYLCKFLAQMKQDRNITIKIAKAEQHESSPILLRHPFGSDGEENPDFVAILLAPRNDDPDD